MIQPQVLADRIIAIAKNSERNLADEAAETEAAETAGEE